MPDIDIDKIKPGDTVRACYHDNEMRGQGVKPYEFETTIYQWSGGRWAGSEIIGSDNLTILEHIPARPYWADALVVRAADGFLWGRRANDYWHGPLPHSNARRTAELGACNGPITVVLDADGNPPRPEVDPYAADFAWSQYRKEYAPNPGDMATAHKAFHAGWEAALHA